MKLFFIGLIIILFVIAGFFIYHNFIKPVVKVNKQFYGPVPQGYDEDYFRKTGITKPLEKS